MVGRATQVTQVDPPVEFQDDWLCPECDAMCWYGRQYCYKCMAPPPAHVMRDGWQCTYCNLHQRPGRQYCHNPGCHMPRSPWTHTGGWRDLSFYIARQEGILFATIPVVTNAPNPDEDTATEDTPGATGSGETSGTQVGVEGIADSATIAGNPGDTITTMDLEHIDSP